MSSSDSEAAPAPSFGSDSSVGSPPVPFHMAAAQSQQYLHPRSDTPPTDPNDTPMPPQSHYNTKASSNYNPDALFNLHPPPNPLYNNLHEYASPMDQVPGKANGFMSHTAYRTSTAFSAFGNSNARTRHHPNSALLPSTYRDATVPYRPYQSTVDVYGNPTSPTGPQSPYESMHHGRGFDYNGVGSQPNGGIPVHTKQPYLVEMFNTHPLHNIGKPPIQQPQHNGYSSQLPYVNGLHVSQTPYGPHLPANGPMNGTAPSNVPSGLVHPNGAANLANEEISTIFVVGFPEDMQEREFQNMFTFSGGFEAATLKIPNKEYTAYSGVPGGPRSATNYTQNYASSNDPYNLVTVNPAGVVVDGGRENANASWPAPDDRDQFGPGSTSAGTAQINIPPRKQIIGFAKFRTRSDALEARDTLQGRRVDIEKGAVLKAEMAKKNLHTKRGVGPLPASMANSGAMQGGESAMGVMSGAVLMGVPGPASQSQGVNGDLTSPREREFAIGAMNFGGTLGQWRDPSRLVEGNREDEERERRRDREREAGAISAMGLGTVTRGPRERAEEDERERERKRREKDARLRPVNPNAFDAFHSLPISRANSGTMASALSPGASMENGVSGPVMVYASAHSTVPLSQGDAGSETTTAIGPWDALTADTTFRKQAAPASASIPPSSTPHSSPPTTNPSVSHSPPIGGTATLPQIARPLRISPSSGEEQPFHKKYTLVNQSQAVSSSSNPTSSASSVAGGSQSGEDLSRAVETLAVSTSQGSTSPQLPSPASGGSSVSKTNAVDQNPPINTLYVGNLPTSAMPSGYPPTYLEDSLRELFSRRPGFRKLCFRQKSNGPMCFVEFDEVSYATRALNDLYGNTLNGLIKGGGIRLSYSKNPLGVRTPTSAGPSVPHVQTINAAMMFPADAFQPRSPLDIDSSRPPGIIRSSQQLPSSGSHNFISLPPPRFFSPPSPSSSTFVNPLSSIPRLNQGSYALPPAASSNNNISTFSPFGLATPPSAPSSIPLDQDATDQHVTRHSALPQNNNLEATQAT